MEALPIQPGWLLISTVWPEPFSSAAGLRDLNLIEGLGALGYRVVLASAADNPKGLEYCRGLEREGRLSCLPIRLNHESFDAELLRLGSQGVCGVIYDRLVMEEQYGPRVRSVCPGWIQILDTQDLHFLRLSREQAHRRGEDLLERSRQLPSSWDETAVVRELSSLHRVDLTLLISPFEQELLTEHFGVDSSRLALSTFAYPKRPAPSGRQAGESADFSRRSGFCFVGNFRHAPNLDAFRWLRDELWGAVRRRLGGAVVRVWGAYPTQEVFEAHDPGRGFLVMGEALRLGDVFSDARVSLVPVRFGAGIKGKVSDSWDQGVPVVSTSLGLEGMCTVGGAIQAAASAAEFVDCAVKLHEDPAAWSEARRAGEQALFQRYSSEVFLQELRAAIDQARMRNATREGDWVRRMLTHHSLETPRYFGKWLELKESLKN
jgi:glycosyltransferase involved in cell wall biosynthesis